jgi:hypothetical protein
MLRIFGSLLSGHTKAEPFSAEKKFNDMKIFIVMRCHRSAFLQGSSFEREICRRIEKRVAKRIGGRLINPNDKWYCPPMPPKRDLVQMRFELSLCERTNRGQNDEKVRY